MLRLLFRTTSQVDAWASIGLLVKILTAKKDTTAIVTALDSFQLWMKEADTAQDAANSEAWHASQPSLLEALLKALIILAGSTAAAERRAGLHTLTALVSRRVMLGVDQIVAIGRSATERLTDTGADMPEAAADLLALLAMPVALLAASGLNPGGIQGDPSWRSQVLRQTFRTFRKITSLWLTIPLRTLIQRVDASR